MDVPRIDAATLRRRMAGGAGPLLVCAYDVESRFREIEVVGATSWVAFQPRLSDLPKDREIIFYCACPAEATAALRAAEVMKLGYSNVMVLREGVEDWKKAGFEIVEHPASRLFERILVPLDGSQAAESVLYQAERLLCGRKGEVMLFHAWSADSSSFGSPQAAEDYLRIVQARLGRLGAHAVRRIVSTAPITEALPTIIESERASLVAISSHGRETSPRQAVAVTVEALLQGIQIPIFLARAYQSGGTGDPVPAECEASSIRRILVPLDGSSACEAVMPYARELGQFLGALIVILYVGPEESEDPRSFLGNRVSGAPAGPAPGEAATAEQRIEYAAKTFSAAGLETMILRRGGDPISTILDFARPSAVDLIAMTTHGRIGLSKLLAGSVAEQVMREALLPTLLVGSDAAGSWPCASP
ncbi:MAG TPA: universal stress protein [Planctomycetota bacterium]|nr:universal stress protein [Planctomycetota bacterium]